MSGPDSVAKVDPGYVFLFARESGTGVPPCDHAQDARATTLTNLLLSAPYKERVVQSLREGNVALSLLTRNLSFCA